MRLCKFIVDAAVQYDYTYTGQAYILVLRNALHVPAMKNHLMPPFILRETGLRVSDTPKTNSNNHDVSDRSIYFKDTKDHIPLSLNGTFSYLPTTKPILQMLSDFDDIYILTPSMWHPNNSE